MKKSISFVLVIILACALLSACSNNGDPVGENTGDAARSAKYTELQPDENGTMTILTEEITKTARFFNYDADGVTVQRGQRCFIDACLGHFSIRYNSETAFFHDGQRISHHVVTEPQGAGIIKIRCGMDTAFDDTFFIRI